MNQKLYAYALRLLAKRMMTEEEVCKKLLQNFHFYTDLNEEEQNEQKEGQIGEVINKCINERFIDDVNFVQMYLEYELSQNFRGKYGYWQKLQKKGIEKSLFEEEWEKLNPNEYKLAQKLLENNRFRFSAEIDKQKRRIKIQRFLQGRGFDFSVIIETTENFIVEDS